MSFPSEFLDEIRNRIALVDLISRRVKLKKRGREHEGLCPFHNEKTPSFTVSEAKGFFHCFGCGAHGDAIGWVMKIEGLSFPEAVEKLAGQAGLAIPERSPEQQEAARRRAGLLEVLEAAAQWFESELAGSGGAGARGYLERRGVRPETRAAFRLGFAPDRRGALRLGLNAKGVDDSQLAEAGLIKAVEGEGTPRGLLLQPADLPDHRSARPGHRLRRPGARRVQGQVPELARDAAVSQGAGALQPCPGAPGGA